MPLNPKGQKILGAMTKEYGAKKGKSVFYASENSGKLKGITVNGDPAIPGEKLKAGYSPAARSKKGPAGLHAGTPGKPPAVKAAAPKAHKFTQVGPLRIAKATGGAPNGSSAEGDLPEAHENEGGPCAENTADLEGFDSLTEAIAAGKASKGKKKKYDSATNTYRSVPDQPATFDNGEDD